MSEVDAALAAAAREFQASPTPQVAARAADVLTALLATHADDLRLRAKAMLYLRLAGRHRAGAELGRAVAHDVRELDDRDFLYELGVALRLGGAWREAAAVHRRLFQLAPDDDDARHAVVLSETQLGFPEIALPIAQQLAAAHPNTSKFQYGHARVLARLGRYRDAVAVLDRLLAQFPRSSDSWILLAETTLALAWPERWMPAAERIIEIGLPAVGEVWRARLMRHENRFADAVQHLERAIALDAELPEAYGDVGELLALVARADDDATLLDKAEAAFVAARRLLPDDGVAEGRLLELRCERGDRSGLAAARRSADERPYAGLPRYLGRIGATIGDDRLAERYYTLWLETCVEDVRAWWELGEWLRRKERAAEAQVAFRRVVELSPGFAAAWDGVGATAFELGDFAAAEQAYREAIARGFAPPATRDGLAMALYKLGSFGDAVEQLRMALAARSDDGMIQLHYALALEQAGRRDEALAAARRARGLVGADLHAAVDGLIARLQPAP